MLSHIVSDLHEAYVEEILKPQLGSSNAPKPTSSGGGAPKSASDPDEAAAKRIRQAVYDIRYRARREDIPLDQAFNQYMSHTSMNAVEKKAVREKLGMGVGGGGATPVKEEIQDIEEYAKPGEYYLRVDPRKRGTGEKPYVRKYDPSNPKDVAKRHKLESRGIKTTATKYGTPYEGGTSGAGEKYEKKYGDGGKNTVGDLDKDGTKEPNSHEYAGVKDNAIKKAIAKRTNSHAPKKPNAPKKKAFKEGFSNWRQDLCEISNPDDEIESSNEKQIKEKKVDNYSGGKNKRVVNINPHFNESIENLGGHIVESFELNEEYLNEAVDIATEFFYNCGLNENGIDIVIEELGEQTFAEFVFELSEEYLLSEELKKSQSNVKTSRAPKGTKQYATTAKRVKTQGGTKMSTKDRIGSTIRKDRVKKAVEKAKETQAPSSEKSSEGQKKGIAGRLGSALGFVVKKGREDIKRVQDAAQTARDVASRRGAEAKAVYDAVRERGKKVEQSPQATRARRKATVVAGRAAQAAGKTAVKAAGAAGAAAGEGVKAHRQGKTGAQVAGRAAGTFVRKLTREELELNEKAESEQQQKLFGLALSVKRGETPRSEVSAEVLKIVDTMSEREIRKFAKTPHSEVPKKKVVEEVGSIPGKPSNQQPETVTTQRDTQRKQQQINAQRKTLMTQAAELAAKRAQLSRGVPLQTNSYDMEGESIDERTRFARETNTSATTGRPSVKGGSPEVAARNKPPLKYGGSRQEPKNRGETPPSPSEEARKKGVLSPLEHKAALRRNARQAAAKFIMPTKGT